MAASTSNYRLTKPSPEDFYDIEVQNENLEVIDQKLKELETGVDQVREGFEGHLGDTSKFSIYKSNKDSNGIYTIVQHKRADGTLIVKSILSNGTSPNYTKREEIWYKADGLTIDVTNVYTIAYDSDDSVVSEVLT